MFYRIYPYSLRPRRPLVSASCSIRPLGQKLVRINPIEHSDPCFNYYMCFKLVFVSVDVLILCAYMYMCIVMYYSYMYTCTVVCVKHMYMYNYIVFTCPLCISSFCTCLYSCFLVSNLHIACMFFMSCTLLLIICSILCCTLYPVCSCK